MFTDNFLELPFTTYDGKTQEITGAKIADVDKITQKIKIDIFQIESYEEAIPATHGFGEENLIATSVNMKSFHTFLVNMNISEFEKLVNEHYSKMQVKKLWGK